jgi:hypothetical protein
MDRLALGTLEQLITTTGEVYKPESGTVLVYDGHRLLCCRSVGYISRGAPQRSARHARFHGLDPTRAIDVEWFRAKRTVFQSLGLLDWIYYYVPKNWPSEKAGTVYKHQFGVFTHGGTAPDDTDDCPALGFDQATGLYHIRKRSRNRWYVDDFIRG